MDLRPPIDPMLARLARELPGDGYLYEPKWDGFRCLAFAAEGEVDLRSRHHRPLARYFPEVTRALRPLAERGCVLDGELVIARPAGFDFAALLGRLHPSASRVEKLAREAPATFVGFDALAIDGDDLRARPFQERRARLEDLLAGAPPGASVTSMTSDAVLAREWLERYQGAGIDGVVAKHASLTYQPGKRAMIKVKKEHTADCVLGGFRVGPDSRSVASLVLGLYDGGVLRHVGVSSSFSVARRRSLFDELLPFTCPLPGHPWERGFNLGHSPVGRLAGSAGRWDPGEMTQDWVPVQPRLVCEIGYDQVDAGRFRHPGRFVRWRPDRDPLSCGFDQLAIVLPAPAEALQGA
jgi:ATP-dependent DNA ligase